MISKANFLVLVCEHAHRAYELAQIKMQGHDPKPAIALMDESLEKIKTAIDEGIEK